MGRKGAPSSSRSSGSSRNVYLTPQIEKLAKRREGLCPSLLPDDHVRLSQSKNGNGLAAVTKSYQTNTKYLTSVIQDLESEVTKTINK